jgi:hypothetical protein
VASVTSQAPPNLGSGPRIESTIAGPELNRVDEQEEGPEAAATEVSMQAAAHSPVRLSASDHPRQAGIPAGLEEDLATTASPSDENGKDVRRDSFTPGGGRLYPAPPSGRLSPAWSATSSARSIKSPGGREALAKLLAGPSGHPVTREEFERLNALRA